MDNARQLPKPNKRSLLVPSPSKRCVMDSAVSPDIVREFSTVWSIICLFEVNNPLRGWVFVELLTLLNLYLYVNVHVESHVFETSIHG